MLKKMMTVREYALISDLEEAALSKMVTEKLAKGWSLYGNPFCGMTGENINVPCFCQAVVRNKEVERTLP
jgi:hypothetical protein